MAALALPDTSALEPPPSPENFYAEVIRLMAESEIPFLLSGTYALACYTEISRPTKDVDVFVTAGDCLKMLAFFKERDFDIQMVDERWLARICRGELFVDVIFNMPTAQTHVTEEWFENAPIAHIFDVRVRLVPPTELIWSKIFVQDRYRYDGADVAHVILKKHAEIDWRRLLNAMELYWEVLLIHVLNFRFIYPTERECIPRWLFEELLERLHAQAEMPAAQMRICRGRLFSPRDYVTDIAEWGFADVVGKGIEEKHERKK
jgi:Nucleotidyl transferase of unknown function (DUF2204)